MKLNRTFLVLTGLALAGAAVLLSQSRQARDPRSFEFKEAVQDTKTVIFSQQSTAGFGEHPRGSDDLLFIAQELLGRPTGTGGKN